MRTSLLACGGSPALTGAPIQSPFWWESKISLATDLAQGGPLVTPDSNDHYALGLYIGGNARMGEATGNTAYYDRAYYYVLGIMNLAMPVSGGFLGWLSSADGNQEASLREVYCWRQVPGLLLATKTLPQYATQYAMVKAFLEQNIWTKWRTRGANYTTRVYPNLYRSVLHIASHWAVIGLYLSTEGSTADLRAQGLEVATAISHGGMPNWSGANIYAQVRKYPHPTGGPTVAFWPMYWTGTLATEPHGSDTQHGVAIGTFVSAALRVGFGPWTVSGDIPRLTRLRDIFMTYPGNDVWNTLEPDGSSHWAGKMAEFGLLAQFDRTLQQWLEADEARGVANNMEKYGAFALNAARLGGPYL